MEFLKSIRDVKNNQNNLKNWEQEQNNLDARRKALYKKNPPSAQELEKAKSLSKTVIDAVDILDDYSETKARDMEMATETLCGLAVIPLVIPGLIALNLKKHKLAQTLNTFSLIATFALSFPLILWSTSKQKEASRIARFQAREKELNDPVRFVELTAEQFQQAKESAKKLPDEPKKKEKGRFIPFYEEFKTFSSLKKDKKAYKNWMEEQAKTEPLNIEKKRKNSSPEMLEKAKKEQDIIIRIIKKINMDAEEYSENMETAAQTVSLLSTMGGGIIGGIVGTAVSFLQNKFKLFKSIPKEFPLGIVTGSGVAILTPIMVTLGSHKYIKEAAKIGRFKAKQELTSNPDNITYFNEEQYKSVSDIKAPAKEKGFWKNIMNNAKFFFKLRKHGKEYDQYKEKDEKFEKKLRKAIKQIKVSDEQLLNAKNLQEKVFNVFEKSDEMWQRYSEDTESIINMANQIVGITPSLVLLGLAGLLKLAIKNPKSAKFLQKSVEKIKNNQFIQKNPKTVIFGFLSAPFVLGTIFLTYASQAYFTKLQKDAGKIGFMKAMEDLKNPVYFIDLHPTSTNTPDKTTDKHPATQKPDTTEPENPKEPVKKSLLTNSLNFLNA